MQLCCGFIAAVLLVSGLDPGFFNWG